jgi:hypothetical protein
LARALSEASRSTWREFTEGVGKPGFSTYSYRSENPSAEHRGFLLEGSEQPHLPSFVDED